MSFISKFIFEKVWGWKNTGKITIPKFVLIVVPHTSNWDFPLGVLTRDVAGLNHCKYVGKSSLFVFPFGYLFRWLGGLPVDRNKNTNFVQSVANLFPQHERLGICMSPEGTRTRVNKFRTGFYYIAKTANVPLILCTFDWAVKEIRYAEPFHLTDDYEADMRYILSHYNQVQGRNYVFESSSITQL